MEMVEEQILTQSQQSNELNQTEENQEPPAYSQTALCDLSVNIITTENELEQLNELIATLPLGCEVVIVVNKKSDCFKVEFLEQSTDMYYRDIKIYEWQYKDFSFAKARNIAIEHSTRGWILAIDSDERLAGVPHDWANELHLVPIGIGGFYVGQTGASINLWKRQSEQGYYTVETLRLFRRHDSIRWIGYAHEQILPSIERQKLSVLKSEILLVHFGYTLTKERAIQKLERNVSLLIRQLAVYPEQSTEFFQQILCRDLTYLINERK